MEPQLLYSNQLLTDPDGDQGLGTGGHSGVYTGLHLRGVGLLTGNGDLLRADAQNQLQVAGGGRFQASCPPGRTPGGP